MVYILFGAFLALSDLFANLEWVVAILARINVIAFTLFTFVLFVGEPWIAECASNQLGNMEVKKITESP